MMLNSSVTDSVVKSTTNKKLSNNLINNGLYYLYTQFVGNIKKRVKFQVQYENFSNERWYVNNPNITYFNLAMQITGHGMVQIHPLFSLKLLAEYFNLRKAFKFKPQVLYFIVSHHISPMAFRKTVRCEAIATNQQLTRATVLE
jgi:hypothetical protein